MKKVKLTADQYKRLISESKDVKGGLNRVDTAFKKTLKKSEVQDLKEEPFHIEKGIPSIPNSKMTKKKEHEPINENIFSPEAYQAINHFIQNLWLNPSNKGLDKYFVDHGISWGDIISYLTSVGVITGVAAGIYKVNNFFKRKFNKDEKVARQEKVADIEKISKTIEADSNAPWNKKVKLQSKPESGWKAEPKPFNPNKFKPATSTDEARDIGDGSNYPPGTENDPNSPWNQETPNTERSTSVKMFTPIGMGKELALLKGPDGVYVFDYSTYNRGEFPNPELELNMDDIADYVNDNIANITRGEGVKGFDMGDNLIKLDEPLKAELIGLYAKDKNFVSLLTGINEMTSAAGGSSGAFTGPLMIKKTEEDMLKEMTAANASTNTDTSSTTGAYVQPAIWAKNKKNWKGNKKTQWPHGEFVEFGDCTKLNNNKEAQKGKCNSGAGGPLKTKRTKQSVISKTIYEVVAEKTGKTVDEVKNIIETKLNNNQPLTKN